MQLHSFKPLWKAEFTMLPLWTSNHFCFPRSPHLFLMSYFITYVAVFDFHCNSSICLHKTSGPYLHSVFYSVLSHLVPSGVQAPCGVPDTCQFPLKSLLPSPVCPPSLQPLDKHVFLYSTLLLSLT